MDKVINLVKPYYDKVLHITYENKKVSSYFELVEQKSGVNRGFIIAGFFVVLAIYLIFGYAAQLVCNVIAFVYPAYASVKALESHRKDDDTRWLTYWVVFALFSTAEFFTDILLSWFPFYWLAKCVFLIWCFLPVPWNGSTFIYSRLVRPYFLKNQKQIDATMSNVKDSLDEAVTKAPKFINYEASSISD